MQTDQASKVARNIETQFGRKAKRDLIRTIQEGKGESPCFQSGKEYCEQYECKWWDECKPSVMKPKASSRRRHILADS